MNPTNMRKEIAERLWRGEYTDYVRIHWKARSAEADFLEATQKTVQDQQSTIERLADELAAARKDA